MYTLRQIVSNSESNFNLGDSYYLVTRESNPEEFLRNYCKIYENIDRPTVENLEEVNIKAYAIVTSEGGREAFILYLDSFYYIMTDTGKTFCNLTHR